MTAAIQQNEDNDFFLSIYHMLNEEPEIANETIVEKATSMFIDKYKSLPKRKQNPKILTKLKNTYPECFI